MRRAIFVLAYALAMPIGLEAQVVVPRLSLDEAIATALQYSRTIETATLDEQKAEAQLESVRTRRYPSVSFTGQVSQLLRPVDITFPSNAFGIVPVEDATITTGRKVGAMVSAQITQPITQLGRLNLNVRISEAARDANREATRAARLGVANKVRQVYYSILQLQASLDTANHTIASLTELSHLMQSRLAQQVVLRVDSLDVDSRLAEAELRHLTVRNDLLTAKEQLSQLMGQEVTRAFDVQAVEGRVPFEGSLDLVAAQAVATRPDVVQARLKVRQAELGQRAARAAHIPDVSLAFSYYTPIRIEGAPQNITTLGIQVDWEPFDWGRKSQAVKTGALEVQQARLALREAEDRALLEIRSSHRKLAEAGAAIRVARLAQEGSRERARVRQVQFQVEASLVSDVLQAQSELLSASNQYEHALIAYWRASADFEHALGQD
jgi:outer membrane protein TolC